jgi:hypothetical protein
MNQSTGEHALAPGHKPIWNSVFTFIHFQEFV